MRAIGGFRGEADLRTWLLSIGRHRWYHHLRRKNTRPEAVLLQDFLPDTAPALEDTVHYRMVLARVLALLSSQPQRTQDIVRMRLQGYSLHEIAQAHGITEQSARVIDFRCKAKLRKQLSTEGLYL